MPLFLNNAMCVIRSMQLQQCTALRVTIRFSVQCNLFQCKCFSSIQKIPLSCFNKSISAKTCSSALRSIIQIRKGNYIMMNYWKRRFPVLSWDRKVGMITFWELLTYKNAFVVDIEYICICICVCMYVCMHTHTHTHTLVCDVTSIKSGVLIPISWIWADLVTCPDQSGISDVIWLVRLGHRKPWN